MDGEEIQAWRRSAAMMLLIASAVFLYQQFIDQLFHDSLFVLCVFYIPAIIAIVIYLTLRTVGERCPPSPN